MVQMQINNPNWKRGDFAVVGEVVEVAEATLPSEVEGKGVGWLVAPHAARGQVVSIKLTAVVRDHQWREDCGGRISATVLREWVTNHSRSGWCSGLTRPELQEGVTMEERFRRYAAELQTFLKEVWPASSRWPVG